MYTAILPCSCPPYRFNPSNHATCEYTYDRDLKTSFVSLKTVNDDVTDNPNGINKLTVHQLKEELRTRGLKLNGNKPQLMARLVQHLEDEEALENDEIIESYDVTVVNCDATVLSRPRANDATVTNGCTADATVVNGGITSSLSTLTTTINPSATVTNGCTADTTVVNGGATSSLSVLTTTINPSATIINGGTTDTTAVNGGATSSLSTLTTTINPSATIINGGTVDTAIDNGGATSSLSTLTTTINPSATVINGCTGDTTVVNGGATSTFNINSISNHTVDIHSLAVAQIKEQLHTREMRLSGNKALLKERLIGDIVVNVSSAPAALPNCNILESKLFIETN